MNQRSCLGNVMFIGHGNSPAMHVLYHLQKILPFSATKMQTKLHACTLPIKPINAHAIPSNQAYHRSCKRQWLIRQKATYITFLCHEQTSISSKSGTRLPWKDMWGDLSRTYHCPWEKPKTYSMSSHTYKRRGGNHSKEGGGGEGTMTKKPLSETTTQGHRKHYPTPLETTTRYHKTIIIKPPQGHHKSIIIKSITSHHEIIVRSPSHTIKAPTNTIN